VKVGGCPSCGADIEFRPGAGPVKVCDHCSTVVFKGDAAAKLEARGKVAELLDLDSPLTIGLTGRFGGTGFTVVGRIQKTTGKANWDEWYLAFEDERTAWLAESEGEWKLLFPVSADVKPPSPAQMEPMDSFTLRGTRFTVEERNEARTVSAQGQLPGFHASHVYVDATGPKGVFGTLDEADGECDAFVGNFVSLKDLALDEQDLRPTKRQALRQARCTQCNGPLDLKAPDATKRVACPYCGALLEVQGGQLAFLELLDKPPFEPQLPLGAVGKLPDFTSAATTPHEWACIAFLIRSCTVEGTRYPWEEYLLWNRELGFRWVMHSTGHWTWLTPTPAGEVTFGERHAEFGGQRYRMYQSVFAKTEYVAGECYWQVEAGETARADEFIAPPRSMNVDRTGQEATVTQGVLVDPELLEKAFGAKKKLVRPFGIAPAQPNPFAEKMKDAWTWALVWAGVMLGLMIVFSVLGTTEQYFEGAFSVPPVIASGSPEAQRFTPPFEVKATVPLAIDIDAPGLSNNWLGVSVDLVNEKTSEVVAVYAEPSYYSGTTDGESWSEGSTSASVQTDLVEKGTYVMRVTPSYEAGRATDFHVKVSADDGAGFACPLLIFLLLLAAPLYFSVRANSFETQKWNDAVFQPSPGVSTFPYAKQSSSDDDD